MIGPGGAETEIFWDNSSDRMTDNTLSPYVASLSAAMRFTMLDKIVLGFNEGFLHPTPPHPHPQPQPLIFSVQICLTIRPGNYFHACFINFLKKPIAI